MGTIPSTLFNGKLGPHRVVDATKFDFEAIRQIKQAVPEATINGVYFSRYFVDGSHPLNDYLVFMVIGIILGAFVAAFIGSDLGLAVLRGPRISPARRLWLALAGGLLVGFAARLARGCTSGLALVGGAQLSVGAWAFMICVFAGGFGAAYFFRKQWI